MKALGKGSIASIVKVGLHVAGIVLWIALGALILGAIAYVVVLSLVLNQVIQIDLPGDSVWENLLWPIAFPTLLVGAIMIGGGIIIVRRLRMLFESFTSGEPFKKENADHLRVIWITMMALEIARYVFSGVVLALVTGFGLPISVAAPFGAPFQLAPWASILILIVLSEVFREGARLREEQELTI
jgi:hypothetical protein